MFIALGNLISTFWIQLIIKQGISKCLNISTAVEHMIPLTSFYRRYLQVLWIHSVVGA